MCYDSSAAPTATAPVTAMGILPDPREGTATSKTPNPIGSIFSAAASAGGNILGNLIAPAPSTSSPMSDVYRAQGAYGQALAEKNAAIEEAKGAFELSKFNRNLTQAMGKQRARYGASGVDANAGSAAAVAGDMAFEGSLGRQALAFDTAAKADSLRQKGAMDAYDGELRAWQADSAQAQRQAGRSLLSPNPMGQLFGMGTSILTNSIL